MKRHCSDAKIVGEKMDKISKIIQKRIFVFEFKRNTVGNKSQLKLHRPYNKEGGIHA